jgi:predicted DNA-binding transcriptional regulator YafY
LDRTERFYKIDQLLKSRRMVPLSVFITELGVSRSTVKRDIEYLRDRLLAPIVWDRSARGYRFDTAKQGDDARQTLPGLWFNASEVHALLTMEHLLSSLQPGLLSAQIEPLRSRIHRLLDGRDHASDEVLRRVRVFNMASRPVALKNFETVASAVLGRRRLHIDHYNRRTDATVSREVSPQRLVHYRDNWYLDAWCHLRDALRSFAVDAIVAAKLVDRKAKTAADNTLDKELGTSYGIFAGRRTQTAVLRFSPDCSRWVSGEVWHPRQESEFDNEGYLVLRIPYSKDTELLMDILRYGPDVEVIGPRSLRDKLRLRLEQTQKLYGK